MIKTLSAALLAWCCFTSQSAWAHTPQQIRMIEQEYAGQHNGRLIPDNQLEYYLDRSDSGWSMEQISRDMARASWAPQRGWMAREVVCSSIKGRYHECRIPFRGHARITDQLSATACVRGRTWGEKPGAIWVSRGCRARFGVVGGRDRGLGDGQWVRDNNYAVTCSSRDGRRSVCTWDNRYGTPRIVQQISSRACIEGRDWGYDSQGGLWVDAGCEARFGYMSGGSSYPGNGGWVRDSNYAVECSSMDGRRTVCTWDTRYGTPRVLQQLSSSACVEGRDWGYDSNGGLWVDAGCRARFGYR